MKRKTAIAAVLSVTLLAICGCVHNVQSEVEREETERLRMVTTEATAEVAKAVTAASKAIPEPTGDVQIDFDLTGLSIIGGELKNGSEDVVPEPAEDPGAGAEDTDERETDSGSGEEVGVLTEADGIGAGDPDGDFIGLEGSGEPSEIAGEEETYAYDEGAADGLDFSEGMEEEISWEEPAGPGDYTADTGSEGIEDYGAAGDSDAAGESEPEYIEDYSTSGEEYVEEESGEQWSYLGQWTVSFYCNCEICTGQWAGSPTASGAWPSPWWTAATGDLPFGTVVYVDGYGYFEIQDRGTGYGWIDIFLGDHQLCLDYGLDYRDVWIVG